ncbi:MAG: hypothetical protein MPF33_00285 [Candidatus Aramenus sp.]|jgi:hypothetical protein|nr:hypothetical protein [Candidatus Aramenus sp.]
MDLGKGLGLLAFAVIVIVNLYFLNVSQIFNQGVYQIMNLRTSLENPGLKFYFSDNDVTVCVQNPDNFTITIYNITGNYMYLPKSIVVYPHSEENVTPVITDYQAFAKEVSSGDYNVSLEMSFLGLNVTFHEVI